MAFLLALKSGASTSIVEPGTSLVTSKIVWAKCKAPPSAKSSRHTEVIMVCFNPIILAALAIFLGSSKSILLGSPLCTEQNAQFLRHTSPKIIKVTEGLEKHSPILGHFADSHTVLIFISLRTALIC